MHTQYIARHTLTRRDLVKRSLLGAIGLGACGMSPSLVFSGADDNPLAPQPPHFPAKAKRVILLFMPGGVSHVDTFDPKPTLNKDHGKSFGKDRALAGSLWNSKPYGKSGIAVSDLFPHLGECV
ncbi:MAG TPA: DUF1501 domain-containing protein, partial [Pirellulaceae bacterium]|nr:DUF1501 domain-containing protein [Pirellulaceae bacterium]